MKLPGTYFAYALGMALFGQDERRIHILLAVSNALTIVLLFFLGVASWRRCRDCGSRGFRRRVGESRCSGTGGDATIS